MTTQKPTAELIAFLRDQASTLAYMYEGADYKLCADRLAELEAALTWQPIETAPKDGSEFDCLIDGLIYRAKYDKLDRFLWLWHSDMGTGESYLIHKINGKELREQTGEHKEEYRKSWCIWCKGFDFAPTHWRKASVLPQALQPKEADNA